MWQRASAPSLPAAAWSMRVATRARADDAEPPRRTPLAPTPGRACSATAGAVPGTAATTRAQVATRPARVSGPVAASLRAGVPGACRRACRSRGRSAGSSPRCQAPRRTTVAAADGRQSFRAAASGSVLRPALPAWFRQASATDTPAQQAEPQRPPSPSRRCPCLPPRPAEPHRPVRRRFGAPVSAWLMGRVGCGYPSASCAMLYRSCFRDSATRDGTPPASGTIWSRSGCG